MTDKTDINHQRAASVARLIDRTQGNTVTLPMERAQVLADAYLELKKYMDQTAGGVATHFSNGTAVTVTQVTALDQTTLMPKLIAVMRVDSGTRIEGLYEWSAKNTEGKPREVHPKPGKRKSATRGAVLTLVRPVGVSDA